MPSRTLISSLILLAGAAVQEIVPVRATAHGADNENFLKRHPTPTNHHAEVDKRQARPYPTGPAYDFPPLANITPTPVAYTENTLPVISTYAPGASAPISGAPPLPTCE